MLTLNTIIKELKNVPVERLGDIYSIIHSLRRTTKKSEKKRRKILSFAGAFEGMTEIDYNQFVQQTRETRNDLFDREISI